MSDPVGSTAGGPPGHVWVDGRLAASRRLRTCRSSTGGSSSVTGSSRRSGSGAPTRPSSTSTSPGCAARQPGSTSRCHRTSRTGWPAGIAAVLAADGLDGPAGDASIRITVSRGPFLARGLLPPDEIVEPTIAIQAWPVVPPRADHLERGLHLVASAVRRDPANPLVTLKTTSRADYVFARLEARRAGADDALFLTVDDHLSEGTTANIFLVRRSPGDGRPELATPSLDCAILPGTTRSWLLGWGPRVGLRPVEARLTPADLATADEAFLCSSVAGILPVTRFAGGAIGDGEPGPWTRRARADREAMIQAGDGPA